MAGRNPVGRQLSIYVCEDDPQALALLREQLRALGHTPTLAKNAKTALVDLTFGAANYDLAIIDIDLPDLNGDKIVSWLRESEEDSVRTLPILIVTGQPDLLRVELLSAYDHCRLLMKPYSKEALARSLAALIGKSDASTRKIH